jgi:hypothetical protein
MGRAALLFSFLFIASPLMFSLDLDSLWIIESNTGSVSTMKQLDSPVFAPGDTLYLYVSVKDLGVRWGEGYGRWKYHYQSANGKVIWSSPFKGVKRRSSDETWNFSEVVTINLPPNLPEGKYGLGFTLIDAHTDQEYQGWVDFSISFSGALGEETDSPEGPPDNFETVIEGVELLLDAVSADSGRLIFTFTGINREATEKILKIFPFSARIIDEKGSEYRYNETGGGGSLTSDLLFPSDQPVKAELFFNEPAGHVAAVALLFLDFYNTDDVLELRSIPVPWSR